MQRISLVLRTKISHVPQSFMLISSLRAAPKGGKQAEVAQGAGTDYVGIFKERPEPPIRPPDHYPDWFLDLVFQPKFSILTTMDLWRVGEKSLFPKPKTNEVLRLLHSIQRLKIKEMNKYRLIKDFDGSKYPREEEKYDMYEILEAERKEQKEEGEDDEDEEEEDEDEEEEGGKKKGPPSYDDGPEKSAPAAGGKAAPPQKGGKKK